MPQHVFHDICLHIVWHTNNDEGLVRMAKAPDREARLKPARRGQAARRARAEARAYAGAPAPNREAGIFAFLTVNRATFI